MDSYIPKTTSLTSAINSTFGTTIIYTTLVLTSVNLPPPPFYPPYDSHYPCAPIPCGVALVEVGESVGEGARREEGRVGVETVIGGGKEGEGSEASWSVGQEIEYGPMSIARGFESCEC